MIRRLTVATLASTFLLGASLPALSQQVCAPGAVEEAIDTYAKAPFSARTWRVLNGLGDPGIDAQSGYSYDNWDERGQWKDLVTSLAPDSKDLTEPAYNCRLSYPLATLRDHLVKLPLKDPYIKQWLMAQAVVFKACSDTNATAGTLPPPLDVKPELAALQNFDRAYQDASISFYAKPAEAVEKFRAIANSDSPHKAAARYNVANLLANAHNVIEARKEADAILADPSLASVHDITRELLGYIANLEDTADGWQKLIDDTSATLNQPLADINKCESTKRRYGNALFDIDYAGIKAKADDWWVAGKLPENPTLSKAIVDTARKQPMALWMMTGQTIEQNFSRAPWSLVGPKWQAWNVSLVDRAMALQPAAQGINPLARSLVDSLKATNDDATRAALWSAAKDAAAKAQGSCGAAPETAAVGELALQATRLSAQSGKYDEIYSGLTPLALDKSDTLKTLILPKLMQHILATGNVEEGRRLRDQLLSKFTYAASPDDFAASLLKGQVASFTEWVAEDKDHWLNAAAMQDNKLGSTLYNILPAAELKALASDTRFDTQQQAQLSRTAWTRDYARTGKASAKSWDEMLASNPDVKAAYDKVKADYPSASPDHALVLTILRNPRFNLLVASPEPFWNGGDEETKFDELSYYDHNDMNWWCPYEPNRMSGAIRDGYDALSGLAGVKADDAEALKPLLEDGAVTAADKTRDAVIRNHPAVQAANAKELASLAKAPSAPRALTQAAIRWAKRSDGKDGAPEALALAVRATRYGCNWHGSHEAYSKPTQQLLRAKFGTTEWAANTPYWFACQYPQYDKDGNELKTCTPKQWPKQPPLK